VARSDLRPFPYQRRRRPLVPFERDIQLEGAGFGTLLVFCFDYSENPHAWRHSMELFAEEVMPRFKSRCPSKGGRRLLRPPVVESKIRLSEERPG